MAKYASNLSAGDVDTNAFDANVLSSLLRSAPQGAELSSDGKNMDYNFSLFESFSFLASAGFSAPWTGTINGIAALSGGDITSGGEGFSADAAAVHTAIENGDTAALNALFWNGNDVIIGGASNDTLRGFEGRDVLVGGSGNDTLIGDGGNDRADGGTGDDNLFGGDGNDRLFGGAGNDVIVGGSGNDTIGGGAGSDTMTGGTGADTFDFRSIGQLKGQDIDRITDFSHAQGDKIDLHLIDANTALAGDQAFTFFGSAMGLLESKPDAGSVVIGLTDRTDTYVVSLYLDSAGHHLDFLVTTQSGMMPIAADFIL